MTIVELFDQIPVHNIISCISFAPDKIIFLGDGKQIKKKLGIYESLAREHSLSTSFDYKSVNKNDLENIVDVLSDIAEQEDTCIFDLTGGEDLILVAAGVVYEKYRKDRNVQLHRFTVGSGGLVDCDKDGVIPELSVSPHLSVNDCITLHGGAIVPFDGKNGTYSWTMDQDFEEDILCLWRMCQNDPGEWNTVITTISVFLEYYTMPEDPLYIYGSKYHVEEKMESRKQPYHWSRALINKLEQYAFITDYLEDDDTVAFRFKNEQIKMCLAKAGTILELIVYYHARHAFNKDQTPKFTDAATGVMIDWDGVLHEENDSKQDTENEIDVILMKGLVPVFISCKNGYVDEEELYKLNAVAERFGGPYAKKVLVLTQDAKQSFRSNKHFAQRTEDMKIQCIDNVAQMDELQLAKEIKKIVG